MHLFHPRGRNVNDGIPIEEFSVIKYILVDTAMDTAMILGRRVVMAEVDIKATLNPTAQLMHRTGLT